MTAKQMDRFIWLGVSAWPDIEWWHQYCLKWNGTTMMFKARKDRADFDISIVVSDALGGHLGVWSGEWPQVVLAEVGGARLSGRIMVKELIPIVVAGLLHIHFVKLRALPSSKHFGYHFIH